MCVCVCVCVCVCLSFLLLGMVMLSPQSLRQTLHRGLRWRLLLQGTTAAPLRIGEWGRAWVSEDRWVSGCMLLFMSHWIEEKKDMESKNRWVIEESKRLMNEMFNICKVAWHWFYFIFFLLYIRFLMKCYWVFKIKW